MGQTDPHGETAEDVTHPKKKKTLGSFFKATEGTTPRPTPQQQQQAIASELQSYLQSGNLDTEEDPLNWWREHQLRKSVFLHEENPYFCMRNHWFRHVDALHALKQRVRRILRT